MPRRVILHAGFHKTGTTSVQQFLRANRPVLKKHVAIRLKPQMQDLLHATRAYSRDRDRASLDRAQAAFSDLLADLPAMPKRTLIVSAPDLCGRLPGVGATLDYSAAADLLYGFVTLIQAQLPHSETMLFIGTRNREDWLQSAYWDHVRTGKMTLDYPEFTDALQAFPELDVAAGEIAARVPCVTHRVNLEACARQPFGIAAPLLKLCDLPEAVYPTLMPAPHANATPDIATLLQLLTVNRTANTDQARIAVKKAVLTKAGLA